MVFSLSILSLVLLQALSGYIHGSCGQTIRQLNTLYNNPDEKDKTEIEVTDPTHPLFGRRFALIWGRLSPELQRQISDELSTILQEVLYEQIPAW